MTEGSAKGVVLDSSVLYYGKDLPTGLELAISPGVASELERHGMGDRLALLLATRVKILSPSKQSLARVLSQSEKSGDVRRLSSTDKEVLALALDLGFELMTDDYSIQNMAALLGIPCKGLDQKGIAQVVEWVYRCTGCGRASPPDVTECSVCGSPTRARSRKIDRRKTKGSA